MDYYADDEIDWLSVHLVAKDQQRMKLKGKERIEAIKIMTARGFSVRHQAWLLCIMPDTMRSAATRAGIQLPWERPAAHWTLGYIDRRK
jgi:hypothetical protein